RFIDAVRRHGRGEALDEGAAAHLAVCSRCQSLVETEQRVMALIGSALQDVKSVRPSPDFGARARARAERMPARAPFAWWKAAALTAAAALAFAVATDRGRQEPTEVSPPASSAAPLVQGDRVLPSEPQQSPLPPLAASTPPPRATTPVVRPHA